MIPVRISRLPKTLTSFLLAAFFVPVQADEVFSVPLPECDARLERRTPEPELLLVRTDCALSLSSLSLLLEQGVQGMFPENQVDIRSVHLGRLMNYPEWSRTLAQTAAKSPTWDSRRGRPQTKTQHVNHWVTQQLNGNAYPRIFKTLFNRYGLSVCVADVEKVLVFEADEILSDDVRNEMHIKPKARLPVDAQVWLSLKPLGSNCSHP